jgi:hypothetical protein
VRHTTFNRSCLLSKPLAHLSSLHEQSRSYFKLENLLESFIIHRQWLHTSETISSTGKTTQELMPLIIDGAIKNLVLMLGMLLPGRQMCGKEGVEIL